MTASKLTPALWFISLPVGGIGSPLLLHLLLPLPGSPLQIPVWLVPSCCSCLTYNGTTSTGLSQPPVPKYTTPTTIAALCSAFSPSRECSCLLSIFPLPQCKYKKSRDMSFLFTAAFPELGLAQSKALNQRLRGEQMNE